MSGMASPMALRDARSASEKRERFSEMSAGYDGQDWLLLGAIAAETRLGFTVLEAMGLAREVLERHLGSGVVVVDGEIRPLFLRQGRDEPAFAIAPSLRQVVLRRAEKAGALGQAVLSTTELLGRRSGGALILKLQSGRLIFRPNAKTGVDLVLERELRESICDPWDGVWLQKTWGKRSASVVRRVLLEAMRQLQPCGEVFLQVSSGDGPLSSEAELLEVLACQALHRGDTAAATRFMNELGGGPQLGLRAVLHFQAGNTSLAQKLLDQSVSFASRKTGGAHAWTPLLALLSVTRNTDGDDTAALKWLGARDADTALKSARRGLRTFLKYRAEPESRLKRIDAHQIPSDASAWEVLFLALAVHAFLEQEWTRKAWAGLLFERASLWDAAGYSWMARQAWVLSRVLDEEAFDARGQVRQVAARHFAPEPGDLCYLIAPREKWQIGLSALEEVAFALARPTTRYRVEWYVTPDSATLNKPALQEHTKEGGWASTRRLDFRELRGLFNDLPPEDRKVISAIQAADSREFPHGPALLALVSHPRVVDASRGGLPLEVARGTCRVETQETPLGLRIVVEPSGLKQGLNVVRESDTRLTVFEVSAGLSQVMQTLPSDLCVPHAHAPAALKVLGRLAEGVPVVSPLLSASHVEEASSLPCLRIAPALGAWIVELGVRPFGPGGRFFVAGTGPGVLSALVEGRRVRRSRDFEAEKSNVATLIAACPVLLQGQAEAASEGSNALAQSAEAFSFTLGQETILELLAQLRQSGLRCQFEWPSSPPFALVGHATSRSLNVNLRSRKGWYIVSGSVQIDEVTAFSLSELARMPSFLLGRFVQLKSGDFVELEERVRRVLAVLAGAESEGPGGAQLRLGPARLAAFRDLVAQSGEEISGFTLDEETQAAIRRYDTAEAQPTLVPDGLRVKLRPYQKAGFTWLARLAELGLGACLADDMGLGKTVQILALLLSRPPGTRHLVVAPTSVCTNWVREIERFAPGLRATEYLGAKRAEILAPLLVGLEKADVHAEVVIVSYHLLHEDRQLLESEDWDVVVLDEAQFIKNPSALRAQAAFSLKARVRIAATGTPVENHLGDLWSIFHFLNPDLLGSFRDFQVHFLKPVQRDGDHIARLQLRQLVRPLLLRRTKTQVLKELPALTTVRREIILSEDAAMRYAILRRQIHEKLYTRAGKENNKLEVLAEITRLRRYCCHPRLVFPDAPQDSDKLDVFMDLTQELTENGHQALIFSQYVDFLQMVRERLEEGGLTYEYLDGSTPKAARQLAIDRFQQGASPLFLISLKAGGLGLNLTAADYVIHLDPWWNPAVGAQATDRAHRMGQTRPVTTYEFVTRDTIEEDIVRLHETKKDLADALLQGGHQAANLSTADLVAWLEEPRLGA